MDIVPLSGCGTWWNGPEFLLGNKTDWPQRKFDWQRKVIGVQECCQNVYGFSDVSNCTTSGLKIRFQQILKLENTVKSNWLGQAIHSKFMQIGEGTTRCRTPKSSKNSRCTIKSSQKEYFKQEYEVL